MEFKIIPGFGIYRISKCGIIQCYLNNKVQFEVVQLESQTSKGSYKVVNILDDRLHKKWRGVHQLVCLTYHGEAPSDNKKYEVNHIDGDKHNNNYTNLEWRTHSDNTLHALKVGLRKDNIQITINNIIDNTKITVYSIIDLARRLEITRPTAYCMIGRHVKNPLDNKYIFTYTDINAKSVIRVNSVSIDVYDYVTKIWFKPKSLGVATLLTGVKQDYIKFMFKKKNLMFIAAGYHFSLMGELRDVDKTYKSSNALIDRDNYYAKTPLEIDLKKLNNIL